MNNRVTAHHSPLGVASHIGFSRFFDPKFSTIIFGANLCAKCSRGKRRLPVPERLPLGRLRRSPTRAAAAWDRRPRFLRISQYKFGARRRPDAPKPEGSGPLSRPSEPAPSFCAAVWRGRDLSRVKHRRRFIFPTNFLSMVERRRIPTPVSAVRKKSAHRARKLEKVQQKIGEIDRCRHRRCWKVWRKFDHT